MGYYENRQAPSRMAIYFYTLALLVPIFSITGHIRRASQLLSVATVMAFFAVSNLVIYCINLKHKIDSLPHSYVTAYEVEFIGSILCIVGMVRSDFSDYAVHIS